MKQVLKNPYSVLPHSGGLICTVIPSLFSSQQCSKLLNPTILSNFKRAIDNYPTYYRNNDRQVVDDELLADSVYKKIFQFLPKKLTINSENPLQAGQWKPTCLNHRFRFCRYQANQYFHRHLDGIHYRSQNVQSKLTFMVYLNNMSEFEGGRTLFYKDQYSKNIWAQYHPQEGDLILFDHNIWHEGEQVTKGQKYVMRSDVVFQRISQHPKQQLFQPPFCGHLGYIWALMNWNQNTLLSGGRDKVIRVWNKQGKCVQQLHGHNNSVLDLVKIDEKTFASCSRDKNIQIWKESIGQNEEAKFFKERGFIGSGGSTVLTLLNVGDGLIASGGGDFSIRIFQIETGKEVKKIAAHSDWVWKLVKFGDSHIISCSEDGMIKIWKIGSWQCLKQIKNFEGIPINTMALNKDESYLYTGDLHGYIGCWDMVTGLNIWRFKAHEGLIRSILVRSNGNLVSGSEDWYLKQWNSSNLELIYSNKHKNFVQDICQQNEQLISAAYDGRILLH